jgi:hypothetical protein
LRRNKVCIGSSVVRTAVAALALVALSLAAAGCGTSGGSRTAQWREVLTKNVSGKAPVKLNLGTHELGTKVRLAWDLSGPNEPPVILTFRLINADYGTGYGYSLRPTDAGFAEKTENAMTIAPIKPGNFTIYFSQRFPAAQGPGYGGTISVYTLR